MRVWSEEYSHVFLLTFRRCAIGPGPSVGPVRAFSFPVASSHLPKVCDFPAFSAHLPKVRNWPGTLCSACTRVFVSSRLFPPSEGVQFSRVFCSPSEGDYCLAISKAYTLKRTCCPLTHYEGVADPHVFPTPSEGVNAAGRAVPWHFLGTLRVASGAV